ncbi:MAG TPA: hypothetical protein VOA87_07665 [Thermoanaerobaculia bacterium]|nr:hypothetical protein [Thermoanaerobaculia bacterium]
MKPRREGSRRKAPLKGLPRWRRAAIFALAATALVAAAGLYVSRPAPLVDLDALLTREGFIPNPGFAAVFRPGDIIQLAQPDGRGGAQQLGRPLLFLKRESCFPGRSPSDVPFVLPATTGQRTLALDIGKLGRMLPQLHLVGREVRAYSLVVENPRIATFGRGELSEQFAPICVERFARTLEGGDRSAWFGTVVEAVIADALIFSVDWRADTTGEARTELRQRARAALPAHGAITTELDSTEKTVLRAVGPLVLGYRYRPMEPVR